MKQLFIALAISLVCYSCSSNEYYDYDDEVSFLDIGAEVPDFTMTTTEYPDGITLSSFRGKIVFIELWKASCPDCQKVTAKVKELYTLYASDNLVFIGISFDSDVSVWQNYINANNMEWIQYHDPNFDKTNSLRKTFNNDWVPTFYLIDKDRKVLYRSTNIEKVSKALASIIE